MSETSEVGTIADEGELTGEMQPNTGGGPVTVLDSPPPSTAASITETIDSREEAHYCDEWDLFSDTKSDASDDEASVGEQGGAGVDQVGISNCQQATTELRIESAIALKGSQQDDTDRQEEPGVLHDVKTSPHNSDDCDNAVSDSVDEKHRPTSEGGENMDTSMRRRIQVIVRVRPPSECEGKVVVTMGEKEGSTLCVQATTAQGSISTVTECTFDRVFMGAATQEDVFAAVEPSVQACLEGYNATVFAYGQTGTGKTHTLFGRDLGSPRDNNACEGATAEAESDSFRMVKSSWGIVPRTLSYLLDRAAILKEKNCQIELHLSFLQIYNDRLFDLLTDRMRQKPLLIREQPTLEGTTTVTVQGLSSVRITSFSNAMQIIHQGHTNRCVRETESNLSSSRSHAIVQLHVTTQCPAPNGDGQVLRRARLNLVDLAGSEKWNTDVEMEDAHSQELKNINTSLSALGNCIAALTEAGRKHIPYRDSTLTRVLQDSFGGNTQSCLIATVNATQQSCDETIRTLHFADRARSVMQTIRVNEVADGSTELLMAKIQIVKLRERLECEQRRRHETRLKEHQALQRDFQDKLKGKDKEITKLSRDNAVFQRWREEDVKKIRALESRVKDLEQLVESKNCDPPKDLSTSTPVQGSKRHNTIPASSSSSTRHTIIQKSRSRSSLIRVGSDNGTAARTYKQVLERYALGSNKEQPQKAVAANKVAFEQAALTDPSYDATDQLEEQVENQFLDMTSSAIEMQRWEATVQRSQADESPNLDTPQVTWHQASGLCVSPVTCPPDRNDAAGSYCSRITNSRNYSKSFSPEWTSSVLSKSTPVLLTQKLERNGNSDETWSPNPANGFNTTGSKQEPVTLVKSASLATFNYNSLPRAQAAGATEPCEKHKLVGCMLCSVTDSFRPIEVALARQSVVTSKGTDVTRKLQDGPCDRHQLLRCFICMKSSASASIAQVSSAVTTNAPSTYSYSSAANWASGKPPSNQTCAFQTETSSQSKCALHSLANCILCAGVKAMTRKVVVPTPQASPAKTIGSFDARGGNHVEDRATDRYRRYTLDERILNQPKLANQCCAHSTSRSSFADKHSARQAYPPASSMTDASWDSLSYLPGFGNDFCSEALPDALPKGQNNPQKCAYGLYAEQLSGTAFTLPRHKNQRSWLYRILPPVVHEKYQEVNHPFVKADFAKEKLTPQQMRWKPMPFPADSEKVDFIDGLRTIGGAGDPTMKAGMAIHMYAANTSMKDKCFYNSDGDFLIVPQVGDLKITTEFGRLKVSPHEICVIQRGIRFSVELDGPSRGYILEVYNRHFILPDLGPIGANGLANPRDFEHPSAYYEDRELEYLVVNKFGGQVFSARMAFSPFNVVAWHGNYVPYKYNLDKFCTMNSVSYDHPDPSIYCVLTCQTEEAGNAVADFVIFPPRWMVQEHTFRPPYFHRNCMSEYMGMIYGTYDAKKGGEDGFAPGGASLHSVDTPHGPDAATFLGASNAQLKPEKFDGGLAFMFESTYLLKLTDYALQCDHNDENYWKCWQQMPKLFNPKQA